MRFGDWLRGIRACRVHRASRKRRGLRRRGRPSPVEWLEDRTLLSAPNPVDLSALNGSNGFRIDGVDANDYTGASVAGVGDVNADGLEDIAVGVPGYGAAEDGQLWVFFGQSTYTAALTSADVDTKVTSASTAGYLGISTGPAGDVNGDGVADFIVGASRADADGRVDSGESFVVLGDPSLFPVYDRGHFNGSTGFRLDGLYASDRSGFSVWSAGDVNGDGYGDVVIGAPGTTVAGLAGRAFVVFGGPNMPAALDLLSLDGTNGFRVDGLNVGDYLGYSVCGAGDVNGDGLDDVLIGIPGATVGSLADAGKVVVVFGRASGFPGNVDITALDGTNGFAISGLAAGDKLGFSVALAGDINSDGFDDIVIGAPYADPSGRADAGAAYVVFGKAAFGPTVDLASLNGSNGFQIVGAVAQDNAGTAVARAGDINGDGIDDLLVGAPYADVGSNADAGQAYVLFGNTSWPSSFDLASVNGTNGFRLDGIGVSDSAGWAVAGAGDVDGDGFDDVLVGALLADIGSTPDAGQAYLYFGGNFSGIPAGNVGDAGNNALAGTTGADTLVGGRGNDTLDGNGGADVLIGGQGDDRILVSDVGFQRVDGGTGIDTLVLDGANISLDLTAIRDPRLRDIEIIDITGASPNTLTLTPREVARISGTSNQLRVIGDGDDQVNLGTGWQLVGVQTIGFTPYLQFRGIDVHAELLVAASVPVHVGVPLAFGPNPLVLRVAAIAGQSKVVLQLGSTILFQADPAVWSSVPDTTFVIDGTTLADELTIDFSGGNPLPPSGISFNGGDPTSSPGDRLKLTGILPGGPFATVSHWLTGFGSGQVVLDNLGPVTYSGLEPVVDMTVAHVKTIQAPTTADVVNVGDDAGTVFGVSEVVSGSVVPTFESIRFLNPIDELIVSGGAGDDQVNVNGIDPLFSGRLTVVGEAGNDVLDVSGAPQAVTLLGTEGNDTLIGSNYADSLDGGDGADQLWGGDGDDTLDGAAGNDTLNGQDGSDRLVGGDDNDSLNGGWLDDTLQGEGGDDTLQGGFGNDVVDGGVGTNRLYETADIDLTLTPTELIGLGDRLYNIQQAHLVGGPNPNVLNASTFIGAVTLDGGSGDDTLYGASGSDSLIGGAGTDLVVDAGDFDFTVSDTLLTGRGNDTLSGVDAVDLTAGPGNNTLDATAFSGTSTLRGGEGNDTLWASGGGGLLDGGPGTDVAGESADVNMSVTDTHLFGRDTNTLQGIEAARLVGGPTNNTLDASGFTLGPVTIEGGDGNDSIVGSNQNDSLDGGAGNDTLSVTGDSDVNLSNWICNSAATGFDWAMNFEAAVLTGGPGANRFDMSTFDGPVTIHGGDGNDTLIGSNGNDSLDGGLGTDVVLDSGDADFTLVDTLLTGSGQDTLSSIEAAELYGRNSANRLDASGFTVGPVTLVGRDGDDTLIGSPQSDWLEGGAGNDSVVGGGGTDTVVGVLSPIAPAGTLVLSDTSLTGALGTDTLSQIEQGSLVGGPGDDTLNANAFTLGPVTLAGEAGNDILAGSAGNDSLAGGDGNDSLFGGIGNDRLDGNNGNDYVKGQAGSDTLTGAAGDDTFVADAGDVVSENADVNFAATATQLTGVGTDSLNGVQQVSLTGGAGDNQFDLRLFPGTATVSGGDGNDWFLGTLQQDHFDGGPGNDTAFGNAGTDSLSGGAGADLLFGQGGRDTLDGGDGADWLKGGTSGDRILGGADSDTLLGGSHDDQLFGNDGADLLLGQTGNDSLTGNAGNDSLFGGLQADTLVEAVTVGGLLLTNQMLIGWETGIDQLQSIEQASLSGGAGENTLDASEFSVGPTTLSGGAGNDTLLGGSQSDLLEGGTGNDSVDGGSGNDTVVGQLGGTPGSLVLSDTALTGALGTDTLSAVEGASLVGSAGNDTLNASAFTAGPVQAVGGDGNDSLLGGSNNDTLAGGNGADTLSGGAGNDQLDGEAGNDSLTGDAGNDTLTGGAGNDTVNADPGDVLSETADTNFVLTSTQLTGLGTDSLSGVEQVSLTGGAGNNQFDLHLFGGRATVVGGGGDDYFVGTLQQDVFDGGPGNDTAFGSAGTDSLSGGDGNDQLFGQGGKDTVAGGDGNDWIKGGSSHDSLLGGNGDDTLLGGDGNDTLVGNDGNDRLEGEAGNDGLSGNVGNDTLLGGPGDDTVLGRAGNDSLYGDDGNDIVLGGDGADYVKGEAGADTLAGSAGGGSADPGDNVVSDPLDTVDETFTFFADWVDGI